ncbi:MAG: hypothetical protein HQK83_09130 [Fibrobacteria bacterium]|nr:hypothetical protein [Fibrobacteria bacterium]
MIFRLALLTASLFLMHCILPSSSEKDDASDSEDQCTPLGTTEITGEHVKVDVGTSPTLVLDPDGNPVYVYAHNMSYYGIARRVAGEWVDNHDGAGAGLSQQIAAGIDSEDGVVVATYGPYGSSSRFSIFRYGFDSSFVWQNTGIQGTGSGLSKFILNSVDSSVFIVRRGEAPNWEISAYTWKPGTNAKSLGTIGGGGNFYGAIDPNNGDLYVAYLAYGGAAEYEIYRHTGTMWKKIGTIEDIKAFTIDASGKPVATFLDTTIGAYSYNQLQSDGSWQSLSIPKDSSYWRTTELLLDPQKKMVAVLHSDRHKKAALYKYDNGVPNSITIPDSIKMITQVVYGPKGFLFLLADADSDSSYIFKQTASGWEVLDSPAPDRYVKSPTISVGSDGTVYIVYINTRNLNFQGPLELSRFNGNSWSVPETLLVDSKSYEAQIVAYDSESNPIVMYRVTSWNTPQVARMSDSVRALWKDLGYPHVLNPGQPVGTDYLAIDSEDRPILAFASKGNDQRPHVFRWKSDTTWEELGLAGSMSASKVILKLCEGIPVVGAMSSDNDSAKAISVSRWKSGTTWEDLGCPYAGLDFAMAATSDGTIYLVYEDAGEDRLPVMTKWDGSEWSEVRRGVYTGVSPGCSPLYLAAWASGQNAMISQLKPNSYQTDYYVSRLTEGDSWCRIARIAKVEFGVAGSYNFNVAMGPNNKIYASSSYSYGENASRFTMLYEFPAP